MAKIRLQDIAQQAGVSTATVSRLLNKPDVVARSTRATVLAAMDTLGYDRPEALQESTEDRIGIVIPELTNPVFADIAHRLSATLSQREALPFITTQTPGSASEPALVDALVAAKVKGIIFVSGRHADATSSGSVYEKLRARSVPFVFINGPTPDVASFNTDDAAAMRMAVNHLRDFGHTRLALINGATRMYPAAAKEVGFDLACAEAGLDPDLQQKITTLYTREAGGQAAIEAVTRGATGLIFASDMMAIGALNNLAISGFSVPEDVSVVGFDGTAICADTRPALTTIRQALLPLCTQAVTAILTLAAGDTIPAEAAFFQPDIAIRQSTGPTPGDYRA